MRSVLAGVPALVLAACIFAAAAAAAASAAGSSSASSTSSTSGSSVSSVSGLCLSVSRFPGGETLIRVPLEGDRGFSLSFIHSVSNTRVVDVYRIRDGKIVQTAERFRAHGAGLPSHPDEPGGVSWAKDGDEFILRMERPIPKLVVRTDRTYENRLMVGSTTINLNQWEDQALRLDIEAH